MKHPDIPLEGCKKEQQFHPQTPTNLANTRWTLPGQKGITKTTHTGKNPPCLHAWLGERQHTAEPCQNYAKIIKATMLTTCQIFYTWVLSEDLKGEKILKTLCTAQDKSKFTPERTPQLTHAITQRTKRPPPPDESAWEVVRPPCEYYKKYCKNPAKKDSNLCGTHQPKSAKRKGAYTAVGTKRLKMPSLAYVVIRYREHTNLFEGLNRIANRAENPKWENDPIMEAWEDINQQQAAKERQPTNKREPETRANHTEEEHPEPIGSTQTQKEQTTTHFMDLPPSDPIIFPETPDIMTPQEAIHSKTTWDTYIKSLCTPKDQEWEQHFQKQETYEKVRAQIRQKNRMRIFQDTHQGQRLTEPTPEATLLWELRQRRTNPPMPIKINCKRQRSYEGLHKIHLRKGIQIISPEKGQTPQKRQQMPANKQKLKKRKGGATT
jgi:hypothetical protein